ncbi:unnamed protein product, partial [Symbiodinium necroappetens]
VTDGYDVTETDLRVDEFEVKELQTRLEREWNEGTVATSYTLDGCTSTSKRAPNQKIFCVAPAVTDGYDVTETDLREHVFQVTARCSAGYSGTLDARAPQRCIDARDPQRRTEWSANCLHRLADALLTAPAKVDTECFSAVSASDTLTRALQQSRNTTDLTATTLHTCACKTLRKPDSAAGPMLAVSKPRPVKQRVLKRQPPGRCGQSLLAVARNCRECGERLTALEGALHLCPAIFEWTFPAETLGSAPSAEGPCRLVRLGANARKGAADAKLVELWENIRKTQLSHILELPSTEQLASQSACILLALRGKDVLALLSAERITADKLGPPSIASRTTQTQQMLQSQKTGPLLGVAVLWTRRRERRRGLAVALVDRARKLLAPGSRVAFSQPTELGQAFAQQYVQRMSDQEESSVLVYVPDFPA